MSTKAASHSEWYHLIDALRGIALINMVLFHFLYDVYIVFGQDFGWYRRPAVEAWQQFICITFILISGISWHFSRNNLKRGLLLNGYGLLITAVTYIFMPDQTVYFGILNGIGCAALLMIPAAKCCERIKNRNILLPSALGLLSLLLFVCTRELAGGYLTLFGNKIWLPDALYEPKIMTVLGFPFSGFRSSDYFPVFPWFFLFLTGYFLWEVICLFPACQTFFRVQVPLLSRIGKKTVWVYLLHQPILYGLAYVLVEMLGVEF